MSISLYHYDYEALRLALRDMRVKARLTQIEMAQKLSVGQSYISKLERGENFVDVLLYARWCTACGEKAGRVLDELLTTSVQPSLHAS
jgi:transcriptional regulator with XRE-family HTH domain